MKRLLLTLASFVLLAFTTPAMAACYSLDGACQGSCSSGGTCTKTGGRCSCTHNKAAEQVGPLASLRESPAIQQAAPKPGVQLAETCNPPCAKGLKCCRIGVGKFCAKSCDLEKSPNLSKMFEKPVLQPIAATCNASGLSNCNKGCTREQSDCEKSHPTGQASCSKDAQGCFKSCRQQHCS